MYVRIKAEPDPGELRAFYASGPAPQSFSPPPDLPEVLAAIRQADHRLEGLAFEADYDEEGHCYLGTVVTGRTHPPFVVNDLYRVAEVIRTLNPRAGVDVWLTDELAATIGLEFTGTAVTLEFDRRGY
jgi:hypothetical protein